MMFMPGIDTVAGVDFQNKLKIHAALQVLYWQYCIQPREFLIFQILITPPQKRKKYRYCTGRRLSKKIKNSRGSPSTVLAVLFPAA